MIDINDNSILIKEPHSGLFYFDEEIKIKNKIEYLIGVDEVGRGPLAGPVVSCASFIPRDSAEKIKEINDSKKLSEKKRKELFVKMIEAGFKFSFAYSSVEEIDEINILNASLKSMKKSVEKLISLNPFLKEKTMILVDGPYKIKNLNNNQMAIIKGDSKSLSIASASIFAKVIRDNWMNIIHLSDDKYCFSKHKGYPTQLHLEKLKKYGPSKWHRKSFAPVKDLLCVQ